jgi:REP element-mobilizing transposase RayT
VTTFRRSLINRTYRKLERMDEIMRDAWADAGPARHYWRANQLWSGSYFARSAGGAPISIPRQYIKQQNRPA